MKVSVLSFKNSWACDEDAQTDANTAHRTMQNRCLNFIMPFTPMSCLRALRFFVVSLIRPIALGPYPVKQGTYYIGRFSSKQQENCRITGCCTPSLIFS